MLSQSVACDRVWCVRAVCCFWRGEGERECEKERDTNNQMVCNLANQFVEFRYFLCRISLIVVFFFICLFDPSTLCDTHSTIGDQQQRKKIKQLCAQMQICTSHRTVHIYDIRYFDVVVVVFLSFSFFFSADISTAHYFFERSHLYCSLRGISYAFLCNLIKANMLFGVELSGGHVIDRSTPNGAEKQ